MRLGTAFGRVNESGGSDCQLPDARSNGSIVQRITPPQEPRRFLASAVTSTVVVPTSRISQVSATMTVNGEDRDMVRTTTWEIRDVGTTTVEVPAEAKKRLGS